MAEPQPVLEMDDVHRTILESIRSRRRLRLTYNGQAKLVERQCHGIGRKGTELLRAYQLQGGSEPEPLFDVSRIESLSMLDETFAKSGPNYKRNDSAMATIFCQL